MTKKLKTKKSPLPDGIDPAPYKNSNKWTHRRWAWEFLRRNESFRSQVANLADDDETRDLQIRKIRKEFGLWRFKHPDEKYLEPKPPKFSVFRKIVNLNPEKPEKKFVVTLRPGQLIVAFSIREVKKNKKYIPQQSKAVKIALENAYEKFYRTATSRPGKINTVETTLSNADKLKYLQALRVWDMRKSHLSEKEKFELLNLNYALMDPNSKISAIKSDARKLIEQRGYMKILVNASHRAFRSPDDDSA